VREKCDLLLISPGGGKAVYQNLASEFAAVEPPSLAALFATYLRNTGHSVAIIDQHGEGYSAADVARIATDEYEATLAVLVVYGNQPSASTQHMVAAGEVARAIRSADPQLKIMMTGTHPAALPRRTMQEEAVDFVCSGEGPRTIWQTLLRLKADKPIDMDVPDLYYRVGGVIMNTPSGGLIDNLDVMMPNAAWDLLPMKRYRAHNWHCFEHIDKRQPYASMHTTLGCPFRCSFCCIQAPFVSGQKGGGNSYRMWSPKVVVDELETLIGAWGVRNVKFVDEMFVLNRNHVNGICDLINERKLGDELNIWAYARVDTVRDEFLSKLRSAGFRWLALGIESASKHVRDGVEKGRFGSEDIIKTVRKVQSAGINVIGNYIFGLPDDTHETMDDTLNLALEANCEFANFYSAMAYPGSKLFKEAPPHVLPESWIGYSQHSWETTPLPTETLTSAEVLGFRDYAFKRYYADEHYLAMINRKFGQDVVAHLKRMRDQPLPRKLLERSNLIWLKHN
jgi:anaerobic magnesium-protoporphyrin IX monomethyl ester cyclase